MNNQINIHYLNIQHDIHMKKVILFFFWNKENHSSRAILTDIQHNQLYSNQLKYA